MRKLNKKRLTIFAVIIFLFTLTACISLDKNSGKGSITEVGENEISLNDYFPFIHDSTYEYEGKGNEFAKQIIFLEFENGQRGQYRNINSGTETVKIIERTVDTIREIYVEGEFYHTENILSVSGIKSDILLKEPLKKGNAWETEEGYKREITEIQKEIETPYKTFKALEVTTYLEGNSQLKNYYVLDVGLVAMVYTEDDTIISSLLSSIKSAPYEKQIRLYYPFETNNDIGSRYIDYTFKFSTNEHMENIFTSFFKNPVKEDLVPIISENTLINNIFFDKRIWTVRVDFSSELIPGWNVGSTLEYELIRSIVNTFGGFYDTEKVFISIDGIPFSSGHFELLEDEVFTVETEGVNQY